MRNEAATPDRVTLRGVVNARRAARLGQSLNELCGSARPDIVIDLREVESLHQSALNYIAGGRENARRNYGHMKIVSPESAEARNQLVAAGIGC